MRAGTAAENSGRGARGRDARRTVGPYEFARDAAEADLDSLEGAAPLTLE